MVLDPSAADNRRGAAQMASAMGLFVVNDVLVKLVAGRLPIGEILVLRGGFALAVALLLLRRAGPAGAWRDLRCRAVTWRVLLEPAAALASVAALARLPVATVSTVAMTAPLLVVIATTWRQPLRVRIRALALCCLGLLGATLVLQPSASGGVDGWWAAILCAATLALRDLATRAVPARVSSELLACVVTCAVLIAGTLLALQQPWVPVAPAETLGLAAAAAATSLGNLLLIRACRGTDLTVVGPFRYTIVPWAVLAGGLCFQQWPGPMALSGVALIAMAGVALLHNAR